MKKILFTILICCAAWSLMAQQDGMIALALKAAPEELRDGATVYRIKNKHELVVIRQGNNDLVCLADDPEQKGLSVSCYHKDLEPFMTRGRVLRAEGKSFQEVFDIREKEVKEGKLKMPKQPASLYAYTANDGDFDPKTGDVKKGYLRYVIYIPYATAETTGLPLTPSAPGMPWIMDPGTHRAHIMINPPQN